MKKALLICAAAVLAAGCHGDSVRRDQQKYQTVQEGSASGITSTINAPGATAPPLTATNADTTSDLSLPVATTGTAFGQAGSLAGTLPATQSGSMSVPYPVDATGAPLPRAAAAPHPAATQPAPRPSEPTRPMTSATPERSASAPHPSVEPAPAPTDTAATTAPAPSTDTTTTTSTEGTPKEKPKEEPPPPPSTDTSTTTSPPPATQT